VSGGGQYTDCRRYTASCRFRSRIPSYVAYFRILVVACDIERDSVVLEAVSVNLYYHMQFLSSKQRNETDKGPNILGISSNRWGADTSISKFVSPWAGCRTLTVGTFIDN
jgi:hypothetical protein